MIDRLIAVEINHRVFLNPSAMILLRLHRPIQGIGDRAPIVDALEPSAKAANRFRIVKQSDPPTGSHGTRMLKSIKQPLHSERSNEFRFSQNFLMKFESR